MYLSISFSGLWDSLVFGLLNPICVEVILTTNLLFDMLTLSCFLALMIICPIDLQAMVQSEGTPIPPKSSGEATLQPKSPMDVSDDEQDEVLLKLNEDEL
jgi:hypothetical protein